MNKPNILLVEDTQSLAVTYEMYLSSLEAQISICNNGKDAMLSIRQNPPDLVLLDLNLPDISGQEVLAWICHNYQFPVVIVTAHGSVDIAMELIRLGAKDFLEKPVNADRLRTTAKNCLENHQLKSTVAQIQKTLYRDHYHGFIGCCMPIQSVYKTIDAAAPSNATVFITGESGTGKEVCAEAIKLQGPRSNKPFIAINCGAIPRELIESELFGHIKGAFTGANTERKGAILEANNGTLFLDEIGEMPLDLQTKLLRFLQNKTVQKVGSSKVEKVDVRVICATNRDPYEEVQNGNFREDLYYRLNVLPIELPPLRMRGDDIALLATHFLIKFAKEEKKNFKAISNNVKHIFLNFPWPGNIRQLQNVMRNIVVLHNDVTVKIEHLPPPLNSDKWQKKQGEINANHNEYINKNNNNISQINSSHHESIINELITNEQETSKVHTPNQGLESDFIENSKIEHNQIEHNQSSFFTAGISHDDYPPTTIKTLAMIEREAIEQAIIFAGGNIPKAAILLDVSPSTLYRKKQQWEQKSQPQ